MMEKTTHNMANRHMSETRRIFLVASLLAATGAWADSWYWTGATDNIWSTDANWSKGGNSNVNRMFEEA